MKQAAAAIAMIALAAPLVAHAGVRVSRDGCGPLTVQADDARLSEVLAALSKEFPFSHRVMKDSDPRVTFRFTGSVEELVAALTRHRNVILVRHQNARCPGETVPKTLWVLDGGTGSSSIVAVSSPGGATVTNPGADGLFPPEVLAQLTPAPQPEVQPYDPNARRNRSEAERIAEREAQRARGPGDRPVQRRRR